MAKATLCKAKGAGPSKGLGPCVRPAGHLDVRHLDSKGRGFVTIDPKTKRLPTRAPCAWCGASTPVKPDETNAILERICEECNELTYADLAAKYPEAARTYENARQERDLAARFDAEEARPDYWRGVRDGEGEDAPEDDGA